MHPRLQPGQEILGSLLSTFQLKYGNRIYSQLHANIYCSIGADLFVVQHSIAVVVIWPLGCRLVVRRLPGRG